MFKDTITVFNRYIDSLGTITWYPTVIYNVNVNIDKASIIAKYGAESRDSVVLNVPYKIIDRVKKVAEKESRTAGICGQGCPRRCGDAVPVRG